MDYQETAGEDRPGRHPSPRPGHGAHGADGPAGVGLRDPESPVATGPEPAVRPYHHRRTDRVEDALDFAEWLQRARGRKLGVATTDGLSLGFADEDQGWHIPTDSPALVDRTVVGAVSLALLAADGPQLVSRSVERDLPTLSGWADVPPGELALRFSGDVGALVHTTGRVIGGGFSCPADDAYDALVSEQHWSAGVPQFYRAVGLPTARLRALAPLTVREEGEPWRIVYHDLFLRLLAHVSREPFLSRAFLDEEDPLPIVQDVLGLDTPDTAHAVLVWAALGFDTMYVEHRYPLHARRLPESLDHVRQIIDRKMPVLRVSVMQTAEEYIRRRGIDTLYGRRLLWGASQSEALEHRLMGTVRDVVDVVCAGLAMNGEDAWIAPPDIEPTDTVIRIKGRGGTRERWLPVLKATAGLGRPFLVDLDPVVVWGE